MNYTMFRREKWFHLVNGYIQEENPEYNWGNRDNQRTIGQFFDYLKK